MPAVYCVSARIVVNKTIQALCLVVPTVSLVTATVPPWPSQILTSACAEFQCLVEGGGGEGEGRAGDRSRLQHFINIQKCYCGRVQAPWISCGRSWQVPRRGIVTLSLNKQTATNIVPGGDAERHIFSFSIGGGEQTAAKYNH